jgi:hypothetical protein
MRVETPPGARAGSPSRTGYPTFDAARALTMPSP